MRMRPRRAKPLAERVVAVATKSGIAISHSWLHGDQKCSSRAFFSVSNDLSDTGAPAATGAHSMAGSILKPRIVSSNRMRSMWGAKAAAWRGLNQNASVMCFLKAALSPLDGGFGKPECRAALEHLGQHRRDRRVVLIVHMEEEPRFEDGLLADTGCPRITDRAFERLR